MLFSKAKAFHNEGMKAYSRMLVVNSDFYERGLKVEGVNTQCLRKLTLQPVSLRSPLILSLPQHELSPSSLCRLVLTMCTAAATCFGVLGTVASSAEIDDVSSRFRSADCDRDQHERGQCAEHHDL